MVVAVVHCRCWQQQHEIDILPTCPSKGGAKLHLLADIGKVAAATAVIGDVAVTVVAVVVVFDVVVAAAVVAVAATVAPHCDCCCCCCFCCCH